jgi:uncharacterized protein (DUF362 family)
MAEFLSLVRYVLFGILAGLPEYKGGPVDRRDFIKSGMKLGVAAGVAATFGTLDLVAAENGSGSNEGKFDLVALKGGTPEAMFAAGIAALGGMEAFVKAGQTVVVKPNIAWAAEPERAANTDPGLVAAIVVSCIKAGAKKVYVFDHSCDNWKKTYLLSGIEEAARKAGAEVVSGDIESDYREVSIPNGETIKTQMVHKLIIDSDVFINVPVLKSHGSATLTMSMKNLMGVVWDRRNWHRTGLHECISDFAAYRKPDLNIMDAYRVMEKNGPRGTSVEDVRQMGAQLISTDMVAIDTAGAKLLGKDPKDIKYILLADKKGIGQMNLAKLNIKRINLPI